MIPLHRGRKVRSGSRKRDHAPDSRELLPVSSFYHSEITTGQAKPLAIAVPVKKEDTALAMSSLRKTVVYRIRNKLFLPVGPASGNPAYR
jgi:hypothetical protein